MNDIQTPQNMQPQGLNMMPQKKGNGALIGSLIVVIILIGLGVYVFLGREKAPAEPVQPQNTEQTTTETGSSTATVTDADLSAIENMLNTDTDLSADFKNFDSAQ